MDILTSRLECCSNCIKESVFVGANRKVPALGLLGKKKKKQKESAPRLPGRRKNSLPLPKISVARAPFHLPILPPRTLQCSKFSEPKIFRFVLIQDRASNLSSPSGSVQSTSNTTLNPLLFSTPSSKSVATSQPNQKPNRHTGSTAATKNITRVVRWGSRHAADAIDASKLKGYS